MQHLHPPFQPTLDAKSPLLRSIHPKKATTRWIVVGDSVVYGFGDEAGGGWVERLRRGWMTPERSQQVIYNLGVRGDGIRQVEQRLETEFSVRGELRNRHPDRLILSVGTNDSARVAKRSGRNMTDFDLFYEQVHKVLDRAQRLCPVWFVGMVPIDEAKMPFLDCLYYNHEDQYRYKEATKLACEVREIPYLDLFDLWMARGDSWRRSRFTSDGLHPNSLGYESIGQDVADWEALAELRLMPVSA
jgi:lysophospholipase L1-like esterase